MLASGEHPSLLKCLPEVWLLPVPKIVGNNNVLHNKLIQCHSYMNDLISGRLLYLRDLLNRCRSLPCFDAHDACICDIKIQDLENVVHSFIIKWSQRIECWSYEMVDEDYVREVNALFEDVADFKETLKGVEKYVQSINRIVEQHFRQLGTAELSVPEEIHNSQFQSPSGYLSWASNTFRECFESAAIFSGVWALFGLGAYFGLCLRNRCS